MPIAPYTLRGKAEYTHLQKTDSKRGLFRHEKEEGLISRLQEGEEILGGGLKR